MRCTHGFQSRIGFLFTMNTGFAIRFFTHFLLSTGFRLSFGTSFGFRSDLLWIWLGKNLLFTHLNIDTFCFTRSAGDFGCVGSCTFQRNFSCVTTALTMYFFQVINQSILLFSGNNVICFTLW